MYVISTISESIGGNCVAEYLQKGRSTARNVSFKPDMLRLLSTTAYLHARESFENQRRDKQFEKFERENFE